MNTPTHLLVGASLFARPGESARNAAVLAGALLPDLAIYVLWGGARAAGYSEAAVWSVLYPDALWQTLITIGNSAPLYAAIGVIGAVLRRPAVRLFALAALAHLALDFPVHAGDAHAHFWPISDWRFESPLSYWNPRHHGEIVRLVEMAFAVGLVGLLWRRFESRVVRAALCAALALYLAVPAYFMLALG